MAKITCFSVPGMELWFWSNDHNPPHFHVKRRGKWEYRVFFQRPIEEMFELFKLFGKSPMSGKDRKTLQEMVEKHRVELLREWENKTVRS